MTFEKNKYDEIINGARKTYPAKMTYAPNTNVKPQTLPANALNNYKPTRLSDQVGSAEPTSANAIPPTNTEAQSSPSVSNMPIKRSFGADDMKAREMMRAMGLEDSKIGYDGTNVLYDNQYFLTPDKNIDGTTYTNAGAFSAAMNDYYDRAGIDNELVDVSKHAAGTLGLYDAMTYDESGKAFLAGREIPNQIIMNGQTYAPQEDINKVAKDFQDQSGYKTYSELIREALAGTDYSSKWYDSKANEFAEKEFEYDPANDKVYQAVSDEYRKLAKIAYDDVYAQQAARTGGYANSAALSSAGLAYQKMLDSVAMQLPEYADRAENRYESLYDKIIDGINRNGTRYDRDMLEYNAGGLDRQTIQQALTQDAARDVSERDWNWKVDNRDYERGISERDYNNTTLPAQRISTLSSAMGFLESLSSADPNLATSLFSDPNVVSRILKDTFGIEFTPEEISAAISAVKKNNNLNSKSGSTAKSGGQNNGSGGNGAGIDTVTSNVSLQDIVLPDYDSILTVQQYPFLTTGQILKTIEQQNASTKSTNNSTTNNSKTGNKDLDDVINMEWD